MWKFLESKLFEAENVNTQFSEFSYHLKGSQKWLILLNVGRKTSQIENNMWQNTLQPPNSDLNT